MARKWSPAFIFFDEKDQVDDIHDGGHGLYLSVTHMKQVKEFAEKYIQKYKSDETIRSLNTKVMAQRLVEDAQAATRARERIRENPAARLSNRPCHIYLIKDAARGCHKVGKANNVHSRFKQLKTANPCIELVAHYNGVESDEKTIHSVLEGLGKRIDGEWFNMNEADIEYFQQYFVTDELPF